jgi:hypothetical protein
LSASTEIILADAYAIGLLNDLEAAAEDDAGKIPAAVAGLANASRTEESTEPDLELEKRREEDP